MTVTVSKYTLAGAAIVLALSTAPPSMAANSVAFQIDAAHDGRAKFKKNFKPPLALKWVRDLGGAVSYPLIAKNMVFVTVVDPDGGTFLRALSLATGDTVWHRHIDGSHATNIAYDQGKVFAENAFGLLQAFDADHGKLIWGHQFTDQSIFPAPPTARKGMVFVAGIGEGGTLYAVSENNGNTIWSNQVFGNGYGAAAFADDSVYYGYDCSFFKFFAGNGNLDWNNNGTCNDGGNDTALFYRDRLYGKSSMNSYIALDSGDGSKVGGFSGESTAATFWRNADGGDFAMSIVDGELVSTALSTGERAWTFSGDGRLVSAPITINGYVATGSSSGNVYLVKAEDGSQAWTANVGAPLEAEVGGSAPLPGLGAGQNMLVVPATNLLAAYGK